MALFEGVCWMVSTLFTTAVSGVGFYCLIVAVDFVKSYYREQKKLEQERLSGQFLEMKACQEWRTCGRIRQTASLAGKGRGNGRFAHHQHPPHQTSAVSKGATLFSAYRMSPAFLSCTAKPRSRLSRRQGSSDSASDYNAGNNRGMDSPSGSRFNRNFPFMLWSSLSELSKSKTSGDRGEEDEICVRCKLSKKEMNISYGVGGDAANHTGPVQSPVPVITTPYNNRMSFSRTGLDPGPKNVIGGGVRTGLPRQMSTIKYKPVYSSKDRVQGSRQGDAVVGDHPGLQLQPPNVYFHANQQPKAQQTRTETQSSEGFYQDMLRSTSKKYPFIVPFIRRAGLSGVGATSVCRQDVGGSPMERDDGDYITECTQSMGVKVTGHSNTRIVGSDIIINSVDGLERQDTFGNPAPKADDQHRKLSFSKIRKNYFPLTKPPRSVKRTSDESHPILLHEFPTKRSEPQLKKSVRKEKEPPFLTKTKQMSPIKRGPGRLAGDVRAQSATCSNYKEKHPSLKELWDSSRQRLTGETKTPFVRAGRSNKRRSMKSLTGYDKETSKGQEPSLEDKSEEMKSPCYLWVCKPLSVESDSENSVNFNGSVRHESQTLGEWSSVANQPVQPDGLREGNAGNAFAPGTNDSNPEPIKPQGVKHQNLMYQMSDELYARCENILPLEDLLKIQEQMLAMAETHKSEMTCRVPSDKGTAADDGERKKKGNVGRLRKFSTESSRLRQASNLVKSLHSSGLDKKKEVSTAKVVSAHPKGGESKKTPRKLPAVARNVKKTWPPKHDRGSEEGNRISITKNLQVELKGGALIHTAKKKLSKLDSGDGQGIYHVSRELTKRNLVRGGTFSSKKSNQQDTKQIASKPPINPALKSSDKKKQRSTVVGKKSRKPKKKKVKRNADDEGEAIEADGTSIESALNHTSPVKFLLRKSALDDVVNNLRKRSSSAFPKSTESETSTFVKGRQGYNVSNVAINIVSSYAISVSSVHQDVVRSDSPITGPQDLDGVFDEKASFPLTGFTSLVGVGDERS